MPEDRNVVPYAGPGTQTPRRPLWLLWWVPPLVLALLGRLLDPVAYMRTGASAYNTMELISRGLFLAAFAYIPVLIVLRTLIAAFRR